MDSITCFLKANPKAKRVGEIAYNGLTLLVIAFTSITDFADLHYVDEASEHVYIEELGNTGEYIAIDIIE